MSKFKETKSRIFFRNVGIFIGKITNRQERIDATHEIQVYLGRQNENLRTGMNQPQLNSSTQMSIEQKREERGKINISQFSDSEILQLINHNLLVIDISSPEFNPTSYNPVFVNLLYKKLAGIDPATKVIGEELKRITKETKGDPSTKDIRNELRRTLLLRMRDYYSFADESTMSLDTSPHPQTPDEANIEQNDPMAASKYPTVTLNPDSVSQPISETVEKTIRPAKDYARRMTYADEDTIEIPDTALIPLPAQDEESHGKFGEALENPSDTPDNTNERASVSSPGSPDNFLNFLEFLLSYEFGNNSLDFTNNYLKRSHSWKADPSVDCASLTKNDFMELRITPSFSQERVRAIYTVYELKLNEAKKTGIPIPDLPDVKEYAMKKLVERVAGNFDSYLDRSYFYLVDSSMSEESLREFIGRLKTFAYVKHWTDTSKTYQEIEQNIQQVTFQIQHLNDMFGKFTLINYLFQPLKNAEQKENSLLKRSREADY